MWVQTPTKNKDERGGPKNRGKRGTTKKTTTREKQTEDFEKGERKEREMETRRGMEELEKYPSRGIMVGSEKREKGGRKREKKKEKKKKKRKGTKKNGRRKCTSEILPGRCLRGGKLPTSWLSGS